MLNKKLLQRLTVAGLIAVTTIGFAGCGDEKKSITPEQAVAQAAQQQLAERKAVQSIVMDGAQLKAIMEELTNRPELKGKALRVFQSAEFDITNKRIDIPLLKPDSQMDVVNYTYNFDTKKWGDPTPVKLEKKATPELVMSNTYDFGALNYATIPNLMEQGNKMIQEKTPNSFNGTVNTVEQVLNVDTGQANWRIHYQNVSLLVC